MITDISNQHPSKLERNAAFTGFRPQQKSLAASPRAKPVSFALLPVTQWQAATMEIGFSRWRECRVEAYFDLMARLSFNFKTGSSSFSNHGFFFIQMLLRGEGCGSGKNCGRNSRKRRTVSVSLSAARSPR